MLRAITACAVTALLALSPVGCQTAASASLKVGDCINYEPSDDGHNRVLVDCAQPHAQEVFYAFELPAGGYPGIMTIGDAQQDECAPKFTSYVGVDWEHSRYTINYGGPTEQTWAKGDRQVVCFLEDGSGGQLTGSAKGTAQ